jgi:hypothetical protein
VEEEEMKKTAKKAPKRSNTPTVKDGSHFRWFLHPAGFWTVVRVYPWSEAPSKRMDFDIIGYEGYLVSATKPAHWGPKIKEYKNTNPTMLRMLAKSIPGGKGWWLKRRD